MVSRFPRRSPTRGALAVATATVFAATGLWAGCPLALAEGADAAPIQIVLVPLCPILASASDGAAKKVTALLAAEFAKADAFAPVPLEVRSVAPGAAVATPRPSGGSSPAPFQGAGDRALARGQGLLARARREMQRLRFEGAASALQDGILALASAFDRLESFHLLTDAYLQLAIADLRLGRRDAGEKALAAVVRLAPKLELARGRYPAVFVRMFSQLRDRLLRESTGSLVVTSVVPGETVVVDGEERGVTPAQVDGLVAGRHFVVVKGSAGQVAYELSVPEGASVHIGGGDAPRRPVVARTEAVAEAPSAADREGLKASISAVRDEIRANLLDGQGDEALAKIARSTGAPLVILGGLHTLEDGDLAADLLLYRAAGDQIAPLTRIHFDAELTGARLELFKLVEEAATKAASSALPGSLTLPAPVAADFVGPVAAKAAKVTPATGRPLIVARAAGEGEARAEPSGASEDDEADDAPKVKTGNSRPTREAAPKAHLVEAETAEAAALGTPSKDEPTSSATKSGEGSSAWTAIGLTVLAVGVVGVAGYFGYSALYGKPTNGTPTVTW